MRKFTLGKSTKDTRIYEVIPLFEEGEISISVREMLKRAKQLGTCFDKKHRQYITAHRKQMPSELRGRFSFFSIDELGPDDPDCLTYYLRINDLWILKSYSHDHLLYNSIFIMSLKASLVKISLDE